MKDKTNKRTVDLPDFLYELVMDYAHKHKIYKFSPALVAILKERFGIDNVS